MSTEQEATKDNKAGRLAFAYCKIATFSLIAGKFALPLAALLSATLFIVGYVQGKRDTKCYLRYPLIAAGFWILVLTFWVVMKLNPNLLPGWTWLHP